MHQAMINKEILSIGNIIFMKRVNNFSRGLSFAHLTIIFLGVGVINMQHEYDWIS